jgi:hypothetical protein
VLKQLYFGGEPDLPREFPYSQRALYFKLAYGVAVALEYQRLSQIKVPASFHL